MTIVDPMGCRIDNLLVLQPPPSPAVGFKMVTHGRRKHSRAVVDSESSPWVLGCPTTRQQCLRRIIPR
jgi:hypothetical protein